MNFYELLILAKSGDDLANEKILAMYQPLLTKQGVFIEQRQPRDQDRSLQKGREAKPHDLLAPLVESVQISARDAEHIQTANCNLDEQDAAALQVCKEYLDDRIRHEDDAKQHHDRAGNRTEAADVRGGKIHEVLDG